MSTDDAHELESNPELEQRLPFGELALLKELVTRDQLEELLHLQADRRDRAGRTAKIGTLLVRQGLLTKEQAKRLLKVQRAHGPIEGYQLLQHLGTGGMGAVFRALHEASGREVALKILPPSATQNDRFRARFLREAEVTKQFDHPHLVRSFDQGESDEHLYFAMEFVPGPTARQLLKRRGAVPEREVLDLMKQLLGAMSYYWRSRVVHRDIKPENVLVTPEGQAKLTDLGLCRQLDDDTHLTRAGKTLGTPLYISPELARGAKDIDIRSDLYSLGATCYHLACGVPPFESASQAAMLRDHVETPPPPPRLKNPRLSRGLEVLLLRLLEKRPSRRPESPEQVLEAIARLEHGEEPLPPLPADPDPVSEDPLVSDSLCFGSESQVTSASAGFSDAWELVSGSEDAVWAEVQSNTESQVAVVPGPSDAPRRPGSGSRPATTHGSARRRGAAYRMGSSATRTAWRRDPHLLSPVVSVLGFLVLFGLGVFLGVRARTPAAAATRSDTAGVATSREDAFRALVGEDPERALAVARSFALRHPDDHAGQLTRYEALAQRLPSDDPRHPAVARELGKARRGLEEEAFEALESLRSTLIELVEQGRVSEARARVASFPAVYEGTPAWSDYQELKRELGTLTKR